MKIAKPKKVLKISLGIVIGVICSQLFANTTKFCAPHLVKRTQVLDEEELVETTTSRTKNLLFVGKFFFPYHTKNASIKYYFHENTKELIRHSRNPITKPNFLRDEAPVIIYVLRKDGF